MTFSARPRRGAPRRERSDRGERGASAIELVLYMPLLMIMVLLAVQFCLIYLGKEVASAAAREGSRVARTTQNPGMAEGKAMNWIHEIGRGALDNPKVSITRRGDMVRVHVSGKAMQILPWIHFSRVGETEVAPIEEFVPDTGVAGGAP